MADSLNLNQADFESQVISSDQPVLIDFWATWCGPCKMIAPHVEAVAQELQGQAKVFKVDVDSNGDLAQRYGVMSIPTLLVFKGGQLVDRHVGAAPKDAIKNLVAKHI